MNGPTREQIAKWAYESGVAYPDGDLLFPGVRECDDMTDEVFALVALAYAAGQTAEREACAQVCDNFEHQNWDYLNGAGMCADAIRARGNP